MVTWDVGTRKEKSDSMRKRTHRETMAGAKRPWLHQAAWEIGHVAAAENTELPFVLKHHLKTYSTPF